MNHIIINLLDTCILDTLWNASNKYIAVKQVRLVLLISIRAVFEASQCYIIARQTCVTLWLSQDRHPLRIWEHVNHCIANNNNCLTGPAYNQFANIERPLKRLSRALGVRGGLEGVLSLLQGLRWRGHNALVNDVFVMPPCFLPRIPSGNKPRRSWIFHYGAWVNWCSPITTTKDQKIYYG